MRASSEVNDPGFCILSRYKYIHVYLDGKLVREPITADEELGYVKYSLCDSAGKLILGKDALGKPCKTIQEKYGKVVIKASNRLTRVSVEDNDPGYCAEAFGDVKVFLGGELVKLAITADEELGYVKYWLCENGLRVRDKNTCEPTSLEEHGDVRIEVAEQ